MPLRQLLADHGFTFNKNLGQNFLTVPWVGERMTQALRLNADTAVVEIGPGAGALTLPLAQQARHVTAVELDERLLPLLREVLAAQSNVTLLHGDMLTTDLKALCANQSAQRHVALANLPYYITSPAISALLAARCFDAICIMVQREVVARLTAQPGDAALTAFSVEVQLQARVEPLFDVGRNCFLPEPHVDSAVVLLTPHPPSEQPSQRCLSLVKSGYAMRRKTLLNNLTPLLGKETALQALNDAEIDPRTRAETLSCNDWRRLAASC